MADIAAQKISLAGLAPAFSNASAGGDTFLNDGKMTAHIKNGGASPITVTVVAKNKCSHGFLHDAQVTVAAGETKIVGPFPPDRFNDENGKVTLNYSAITSVQVAIVDVEP